MSVAWWGCMEVSEQWYERCLWILWQTVLLCEGVNGLKRNGKLQGRGNYLQQSFKDTHLQKWVEELGPFVPLISCTQVWVSQVQTHISASTRGLTAWFRQHLPNQVLIPFTESINQHSICVFSCPTCLATLSIVSVWSHNQLPSNHIYFDPHSRSYCLELLVSCQRSCHSYQDVFPPFYWSSLPLVFCWE